MTTRTSTPEKPGDDQTLDPVAHTRTESKASPPKASAKKGWLSNLKAFWVGLEIDAPTLLMMAKGGLPPTIALSMYQADAVATIYSTLGYLVAIVSILGFAIMPRAKFIQTLLFNLISLSLGAAVALLVICCTVSARQHTTVTSSPSGVQSPSPGATLVTYNSSASAVCAIWLFVQIYAINAAKAKFPQLMFPAIMYSIFVIVTCTYAIQFPTMTAGISFVKRLLETFLTGLAIATGVSFVILPVTCRKIVFKEFEGYIGALQGGLKAHQKYLSSLQDPEVFGQAVTIQDDGKGTQEAFAVKAAIGGILGLHGKLQADLPFAKREIALGKLDASDLKKMNKLFRAVMLPTVGMGAIIDIFQRIAVLHGWTKNFVSEGMSLERQKSRQKTLQEWSDNIKSLNPSFESIIEGTMEGLEHVALQLQFKKALKPKKGQKMNSPNSAEDLEAGADSTKPGSKGFAEHLRSKVEAFNGGKQQALREWCTRHGIDLSPDFFDHPLDAKYTESTAMKEEDYETHQQNQRQLYLLLYMEFLLHSIGLAVLDFVDFADECVENGRLSKNKLLVPGAKQMRKWWASLWKEDDGSPEDGRGMGDLNDGTSRVDMGQSFRIAKDPEHLPPQNMLEKLGDGVRKVPGFFRSRESAFGFRVACATMSIAILAFLHDTQQFFTVNRLMWAMIMIAISMSPTAGQSLFSFVLRILGTIIAMIIAFLIYYIPDGKTPGIIVLLWFFASIGWYIPLKKPQFAIIGMISIVTMTLIIGYELEVRKIGVALATSNGQRYLPITTLGPYRLATVAGGLFVAFIWTIIPYPISEHSELRQHTGRALYLLANYYSIVHETVQARVRNEEGDPEVHGTPGNQLLKCRIKVFSKMVLMVTSLKTFANYLHWEIPIGGRFPKKQYNDLIVSTECIFQYISLIGYASTRFVGQDESQSQWTADLCRLMKSINSTSHEITSLLSLLSASVTNGQPLPPYLSAPAPYGLSTKLEALDRDILSVRHIAEPGYTAFAVMQISARCITVELENLLRAVKEIVGELDFSFHVVSTADSSASSFSETTLNSQSGKNKHD
ncbi:hypothetical protein EJ08DRAFT_585764 [Tothia fuscella]|uniref:ER transporter 6TM N-terminal domain-containing protein n=1 Tax=Tothia fuscella TaxID=1048955 RepID=A0A9P4NWI3_9PEZI|nr:hypothetical protein EJ08DRAFT_585764 [Tothia fuscella]